MDSAERAAFVAGYTKLLTTTWSNEEFSARLASDALAAVRECGLEVPDNAQIKIVREFEGEYEPSLNNQIELWEAGLETGVYELRVPLTSQIETAELSEGDLMGVAAGNINCCCCPCCSST
jgi:hypothetical protein